MVQFSLCTNFNSFSQSVSQSRQSWQKMGPEPNLSHQHETLARTTLSQHWLLCLPSHRGGDMLVYLCPHGLSVTFSPSVCLIHLCPSVQCFLWCRLSNRTSWPNAGLCWPIVYDADSTLQYWVTGSCLVSHLMWASVTDGGPTLTQLWFKASCCYHQHEVMTRAEWILPSTVDVGSRTRRQQ